MASNLDYLDPALVPLEDKVKAFLEAEQALRRASDSLRNPAQPRQDPAHTPLGVEPGPPETSNGQRAEEHRPNMEQLRGALARLEEEVVALLPSRNEWLKVNLGYGPSRVGAWHVPATASAPERYELRVVH